MKDAHVFLFVDNSNIFISAKEVALGREGRAARDSVRLQFENLLMLALANREMAKAFVVGSIPPEQRAVWDRLTAATGVVPELYERGQFSRGEQGLDQCLQVHMLRAISDNPQPQVVVLMTGDGAGYDDGVGFHADMARMHAAGWGIEVISWVGSCRRTLREWAKTNGCFVPMDDYYDAVTFLEGGRRAASIDLSKRPRALPRSSPLELAEASGRVEADREMRALKREVEELRSREAARDRKKKRYSKRFARHAGK